MELMSCHEARNALGLRYFEKIVRQSALIRGCSEAELDVIRFSQVWDGP
jgi:hypothetical protein